MSWRGAYPVRVQGQSMSPLLPSGARVLVIPMDPSAPIAPGEVVVARRPGQPARLIVKRVIGTTREGGFLLGGDNPRASTESVDFGPVARADVVGRARLRYWPFPPRLL